MIVRQPKPPATVKKLWNEKNPFFSHYYTSYSLLVPESENYILRSSRPFGKNSQHAEAVKKCFAQEGNHSRIHAEFAKKFYEQGYDFTGFLKFYRWISYEVPEKYCSKNFNLVGAAASEQLNTAISVATLQLEQLDQGEGETLNMLKWHFLEEIEHREVIFDLMVEAKVSWFLRAYVMFNFFIGFSFWIAFGAIKLGFQDGSAKKLKFWWDALVHSSYMSLLFFISSLRFLWPSYHPKDEYLPKQFYELQKNFVV